MDLRRIDWKAGAYDLGELSNLFTGNDARARIILKAVRDKVADLDAMKALGFCVSQDHARYMAKVFNDAGIRATTVLGTTGTLERTQAVEACAPAECRRSSPSMSSTRASTCQPSTPCCSCTTDRELDHLPSAARPGSSARHGQGSAHRPRLRWSPPQGVPLRPSVPRTDGEHEVAAGADIEHGFPFLPAGTQIVLDRQSQELVLENIRSQVTSAWKQNHR